jgi:hypothetical protein
MVPYILGFHPEDSLVLLTLGGADNRVHARADLPEDSADMADLVDSLVAMARRNGVGRAVIVAYSADAVRADTVHSALRRALVRAGVEVVLAIRADGSRWYGLGGPDGRCDSDAGTPYDVSTHPFTAQSVFDGQVVLGSRRELEDSLRGTNADEIAAVGRAADRAMDRFVRVAPGPEKPWTLQGARAHLVAEGHWVAQRVRRFLRDGIRLDVADLGRLLVAIVAIEVRDVAWAEMSHENADQHVALWRDVVRRSPEELLAAPAALLGFAAWLTGDGALAWCAVSRCQAAEPEYSLAGLLTQALAGAVPPSSWEPFDRETLPLFTG